MTRMAMKWTRKRKFQGNQFVKKGTSKEPARRSASFSKIGASDSCDSLAWMKLAHQDFVSLILRSFVTSFKSLPYARNERKVIST